VAIASVSPPARFSDQRATSGYLFSCQLRTLVTAESVLCALASLLLLALVGALASE
jgi:hypothetical protein